ncbi:hypothetical protein BPC006_I3379 [Burkholderia pseudomallei BPC006]|nr:hypothetical protein BPC006_I3379 [Burkholderia pseudomallei BPC006]
MDARRPERGCDNRDFTDAARPAADGQRRET